jgi:hypothetical protein
MSLRRHLTANNVLAVVALFIALGAGAYATGLKRNSVKSKQIKDGAVKTRDIADDALIDSKIKDGSLGGIDVANDGLTGNEVDESALVGLHVRNAKDVGGMQVKSIDYQSNANGQTVTILDIPNQFELRAKCSNGGDGLDLDAIGSANNGKISIAGYFATSGAETDASRYVSSSTNNSFDQGDDIPIDNLMPASGLRQHVAIVVVFPGSGFVADVDLAMDEATPTGPCKVTGSAIAG